MSNLQTLSQIMSGPEEVAAHARTEYGIVRVERYHCYHRDEQTRRWIYIGDTYLHGIIHNGRLEHSISSGYGCD